MMISSFVLPGEKENSNANSSEQLTGNPGWGVLEGGKDSGAQQLGLRQGAYWLHMDDVQLAYQRGSAQKIFVIISLL